MAVINIILGRADNYDVDYDNFMDQAYQLTLQCVLYTGNFSTMSDTQRVW